MSNVVSLLALFVSFAAWRVTRQALRLEHRPVIRVVAAVAPTAYALGDTIPPRVIQTQVVILKNIGRGPGLTVTAFDPKDSALIGDIDVVEPLGPGDQEATRLGRVPLQLERPMAVSSTYDLYYQDMRGAWHLTRFRPLPQKIECIFVGEVKKVPVEVAAQGTVLTPREHF